MKLVEKIKSWFVRKPKQVPYIKYRQRELRLVRSIQFYPTRELSILSKAQLEYFAQQQLLSELSSRGFISYEQAYVPEQNGYHFVATIYVLENIQK